MEAGLGEPFIGPSGNQLNHMLAQARIRREDCWVDNVVRCWLPGNRAPTAAERQYCWDAHVSAALRALPAEPQAVIVAVGVPAAKQLLGEEYGENAVGSFQEVEI